MAWFDRERREARCFIAATGDEAAGATIIDALDQCDGGKPYRPPNPREADELDRAHAALNRWQVDEMHKNAARSGRYFED